jgi:DNA (cytosine-5)-methyltransferase 1
MSSNYTVASLFCGCGGIDKGLQGGFKLPYQPAGSIERLKFDIIWANDFNPKAIKSYRANFPEHYSICGDIVSIVKRAKRERKRSDKENKTDKPPLKVGRSTTPVSAENDIRFKLNGSKSFDGVNDEFLFFGANKVDVVTGGFPCQPFSLAGKREGLADKRGKLYMAMLDAVEMLQPKLFIAENVAGLLSAKVDDDDVIHKIRDDFLRIHYRLEWKLFTASDFGVPQRRQRVIIVGVRNDLPDFGLVERMEKLMPAPNSKPDASSIKSPISISKGIESLEKRGWDPAFMHVWSRALLNRGQGNTTCNPDEPAPTMRAEHHGNIEFHYNAEDDPQYQKRSIHDTVRRKITRRLSVREAALIQSFPNNFKFEGSATDAYRQIGNAVPPLLAWHVGRAVESYLDDLKTKVAAQR